MRNGLVHFKPEFSGEGGRHEELGQRLHEAHRSPFLKGEALFPRAWASHSCASWAVERVVALEAVVSSELGVQSRFRKHRHRLEPGSPRAVAPEEVLWSWLSHEHTHKRTLDTIAGRLGLIEIRRPEHLTADDIERIVRAELSGDMQYVEGVRQTVTVWRGSSWGRGRIDTQDLRNAWTQLPAHVTHDERGGPAHERVGPWLAYLGGGSEQAAIDLASHKELLTLISRTRISVRFS